MSFACPIKTSMPYDLPQIPMSKVTEPGALYTIFCFKYLAQETNFLTQSDDKKEKPQKDLNKYFQILVEYMG